MLENYFTPGPELLFSFTEQALTKQYCVCHSYSEYLGVLSCSLFSGIGYSPSWDDQAKQSLNSFLLKCLLLCLNPNIECFFPPAGLVDL